MYKISLNKTKVSENAGRFTFRYRCVQPRWSRTCLYKQKFHWASVCSNWRGLGMGEGGGSACAPSTPLWICSCSLSKIFWYTVFWHVLVYHHFLPLRIHTLLIKGYWYMKLKYWYPFTQQLLKNIFLDSIGVEKTLIRSYMYPLRKVNYIVAVSHNL